MYNKCPNIIKKNNLIIIETIHEIHNHNIKSITKPDLDVELKIIKDEKDKHFYITNCLFIKCPICLTFKQNCIIQKCGHCLCKNCLNVFLENTTIASEFRCWICRQKLDKNKKIFLKL